MSIDIEKDDLSKLLAMREALNEAIKSQRRLDSCHRKFIERTTRHGFSRAQTTTYNATAASNAAALKSDMKTLEEVCRTLFSD
ncbi:hypothetical protein [Vibrio mediterranei]|uniref:hypothetical protein n=1 Tax=Vibrio mediterranei TaxID=689 RepID=UPI004067F8E8